MNLRILSLLAITTVAGMGQQAPEAAGYDVATVRPANPSQPGRRAIMPGPQGGMRTENTPLITLITFAYDVREFQVTGAPAWVRSDGWDVMFTPDKPETPMQPGGDIKAMETAIARQRQRMQAVLRDRFGLVMRKETKDDMPIYGLLQAKGGHKLTASAAPEGGGQRAPQMRMGRGQLNASGANLKMFCELLSQFAGRPVLDETGLDGRYDFKLDWAPESGPAVALGQGGPAGPGGPAPAASGDSGGPSLFTALTEQLGLRLDAKKGKSTIFAIEKVEKPGEN